MFLCYHYVSSLKINYLYHLLKNTLIKKNPHICHYILICIRILSFLRAETIFIDNIIWIPKAHHNDQGLLTDQLLRTLFYLKNSDKGAVHYNRHILLKKRVKIKTANTSFCGEWEWIIWPLLLWTWLLELIFLH